jgi:hypothetical protein
MQVIVINEKGYFTFLNGMTFPVIFGPDTLPEFNDKFCTLLCDGRKIDTSLKNVLVVDALKCYEDAQNHGHSQLVKALERWAFLHSVKF